MARKPNYSLQRSQRERERQNKAAERQKQRQEESDQRKVKDAPPDEAGVDPNKPE